MAERGDTKNQSSRHSANLRHVTLIVALLFASGAAVAADDGSGTKRVLAIHSYSQDYPWTSGQHAGFIQTLENGRPIAPAVKTEYLDTKRKALDDAYAEGFVRHLRLKYRGFAPDAIYVTDDDALQFTLGPLADLYPNVPVFFSGVNDFGRLEGLDPKRVTGVFEEKEVLPNVELLHQFFNRSDRINVVGDGSATYKAIEKRMKEDIRDHPDLSLNFIVGDLVRRDGWRAGWSRLFLPRRQFGFHQLSQRFRSFPRRGQTFVTLELLDGIACLAAHDAVYCSRPESELGEAGLEIPNQWAVGWRR